MEDNKNLVADEATENVEQTTEQTEVVEETTEQSDVVETTEPKLYTEAEFNKKLDEVLAKKIAHKTARIKKEYENKYSKVETVLNAGLGTKNIDEATDKLASFYKQKGISIPEPKYSERDLELLANAEAEDIIQAGYDEVVEEVDRLADKGLEKMTPREKIMFKKLAEKRQAMEDEKDLASIGISKSIVNDKEFVEFADKLNPNLSLKEKYEMYSQFKPKSKVEPIGSMKNSNTAKVKEYYTAEEINRMTDEDLDDPKVWEAVRRSMTGRA